MNIEKFREAARQQNVDLIVHSIACLPHEIKKYTGYVVRRQKNGGVSYETVIKHKDSKSFKTRTKAEDLWIYNIILCFIFIFASQM